MKTDQELHRIIDEWSDPHSPVSHTPDVSEGASTHGALWVMFAVVLVLLIIVGLWLAGEAGE